MRKLIGVFKSSLGKASKQLGITRRLVGGFTFMVLRPWGFVTLQSIFKRSRWYYLLLAHVQGRQGDHRAAFRTLMLGQRVATNEPLIHIKLSAIHRDNVDITAAHTHLRIAELLKPGYSTLRRLTFEMDQKMYVEGAKTLDRVLNLSPKLLRTHLPLLNRAGIYYPEFTPRLVAARKVLADDLGNKIYQNPAQITKAVGLAIANRWLRLALDISKKSSIEIDPFIQKRLDRLEKNLGEYLPLIDAAWENECSNNPIALVKGESYFLADLEHSQSKVVELFIPPAVFDYPRDEKQTHETIRQTFFHIISILMKRTDLAIVPRMQQDWRQCFPKTRGRIISYHTHAAVDSTRIHVQEAPLAGYCSFDHAGFAGFSSIATDHSQIEQFTADVSQEVLEFNHQELIERFVIANVSKYFQVTSAQPISGNYVFVALQVSTDIVAQLGWMSGMELLENVLTHYRGTSTKVVVKRHPFCRSITVQNRLERWEVAGDIILSKNSIHDLLKDALVVFTVNSGVGLEALMHGKSVIVSGACDYSYAARTVKSELELNEILGGELAPDIWRIREFLYFYVHSFAILSTDRERLAKRLLSWLDN